MSSLLESLPVVNAGISYLDDPACTDPSLPLEFHVPHEERTTMRLKMHEMPIRDGRTVREEFKLDTHGFALVNQKSSVEDLEDVERLRAVQPSELEELIKSITGAAKAMCIGPQVRYAESSARVQRSFNSLPARFVHGDFFGASGHDVLAQWAGIDMGDYSRFAIINAWRAITPPPQDTPLAVCDIRTTTPADTVEVTAVLEEQPGAAFSFTMAGLRHRPEHQWYYFSNMEPDEVLLFKTFDTDSIGLGVPHSAFDDRTFANRSPRGSAEARILTLFN